MRPIMRPDPQLPSQSMKTYSIAAPLESHYRDGTCDEVNCPAQQRGWRTEVDEATELGQGQAYYIRQVSGRRYHEHRTESGLTAFEFPPGQRCFRTHKVALERPAIFFTRDGDWRGNPYGTAPYIYGRAADWVDDFANHQQRLSDAQG